MTLSPHLSFPVCLCIAVSVLLFSGEFLFLSKEWFLVLSHLLAFAFYNASFLNNDNNNKIEGNHQMITTKKKSGVDTIDQTTTKTTIIVDTPKEGQQTTTIQSSSARGHQDQEQEQQVPKTTTMKIVANFQKLSEVTNLLISPTILEKRNKKRELEAKRLAIPTPITCTSSSSSENGSSPLDTTTVVTPTG